MAKLPHGCCAKANLSANVVRRSRYCILHIWKVQLTILYPMFHSPAMVLNKTSIGHLYIVLLAHCLKHSSTNLRMTRIDRRSNPHSQFQLSFQELRCLHLDSTREQQLRHGRTLDAWEIGNVISGKSSRYDINPSVRTPLTRRHFDGRETDEKGLTLQCDPYLLPLYQGSKWRDTSVDMTDTTLH